MKTMLLAPAVLSAALCYGAATKDHHNGAIRNTQFNPDGTRIVTTDARTARVWDAVTGRIMATFTGHEDFVRSTQFNSDGTRIVTASDDKTVRVWDAATGKSLATLTGYAWEVWSAQFSPDGTRIVTKASFDEATRLCTILSPSARPLPEWFPDFLRFMAQMRLNPDDRMETLKAEDWLALRERMRGVLRASANADTPHLRILRQYVRE